MYTKFPHQLIAIVPPFGSCGVRNIRMSAESSAELRM